MDKKYPVDTTPGKSDGVFHAIVGTSFAASVSHETRAFIHMQIGIAHVILFKSKDSVRVALCPPSPAWVDARGRARR